MNAITLPAEYSYVLLAATSTFIVNIYHMTLTGKHRKLSGVKYPTCYASAELAEKDPKAFAFNCAQRAHANFTENLTPFLTVLAVAGLRYPVFAAAAGGAWSFFRILYARGYAANGPQGRLIGGTPASLIGASLGAMALYSSVMFVLGK
ncbi:hypothetical protein QBC47DRAFT_172490 [Echria macrotheca]|uniref:Microsomal glutathione S-transferase 3 n=1 Tax=Echria macrotheca TaxID=438768 RepID=A0AAJ0BHG3_9PEZI|nr:hypothetical protein QBC47DRAFT_172490 [Echria macrotheca]